MFSISQKDYCGKVYYLAVIADKNKDNEPIFYVWRELTNTLYLSGFCLFSNYCDAFKFSSKENLQYQKYITLATKELITYELS